MTYKYTVSTVYSNIISQLDEKKIENDSFNLTRERLNLVSLFSIVCCWMLFYRTYQSSEREFKHFRQTEYRVKSMRKLTRSKPFYKFILLLLWALFVISTQLRARNIEPYGCMVVWYVFHAENLFHCFSFCVLWTVFNLPFDIQHPTSNNNFDAIHVDTVPTHVHYVYVYALDINIATIFIRSEMNWKQQQ